MSDLEKLGGLEAAEKRCDNLSEVGFYTAEKLMRALVARVKELERENKRLGDLDEVRSDPLWKSAEIVLLAKELARYVLLSRSVQISESKLAQRVRDIAYTIVGTKGHNAKPLTGGNTHE